jgi:hypothetical protein
MARANGIEGGLAMTASVFELVRQPTSKRGRYNVTLDDELVVTTALPLYDRARELLKRGYDPAALLTVRHAGKAQRCFVPRPINEHARWTVEETSWDGLRGVKWRSPEERTGAERQSGSASSDAQEGVAGSEVSQTGRDAPEEVV